jgi:hypothetical protein
LESDALPIGATDPSIFLGRTRSLADYENRLRNFAFFVERVRAAFGAELLDRELIGLRLFVFAGGVVARFAGVA